MIQLTEEQLDSIIDLSVAYVGQLHWERACQLVGVEYDAASNQIAEHISAITGDEVDGDGDPWSIVCQHLDGVAEAIADVRRRFPAADAHLRNEYAWRETRDPYQSEAAADDDRGTT